MSKILEFQFSSLMRMLFFLTVLLSMLFASCDNSTESIDKRILQTIEDCGTDECVFSIKDIVDFEWDVLHAFKYNATLDDVQQVLGSKPKMHTEFTKKTIFTFKGDIVFFEEIPIDIEGLVKNEIIFDIPDNKTYKSYSINEANFDVTKKAFRKGQYYYQLEEL